MQTPNLQPWEGRGSQEETSKGEANLKGVSNTLHSLNAQEGMDPLPDNNGTPGVSLFREDLSWSTTPNGKRSLSKLEASEAQPGHILHESVSSEGC